MSPEFMAFMYLAAVCGVGGFLFGAWACVQVEAFKRSTHKVQFVDPWAKDLERELGLEIPEAEDGFQPLDAKTKEKLRRSLDPDAAEDTLN